MSARSLALPRIDLTTLTTAPQNSGTVGIPYGAGVEGSGTTDNLDL